MEFERSATDDEAKMCGYLIRVRTYWDGSPGEIRTLVRGSKALYACPLHHRALSLVYMLLG